MNPEENQANNAGSSQNNTHAEPVLDFTKNNNGTIMAVLAYLGPLVLIPFLMEKKDEFVKFHTKQGIVLFGLEIVIMIISNLSIIGFLGGLLWLIQVVLTIIGIVNAVQGQKKELPVIGSLASNIKI